MQVELIPLDQIRPSLTNPRKSFDESKLKELAESIRLQGVLQPILVRRRGGYGDSSTFDDYELIAGERRWRASKLAGVETIPALVRDLDDKATLEIQVIENLQRSDLSPLEEAEGYRALLDLHGYTADGLADKIGKSKSYVYARLKLNNLPKQAMDAVAAGEVPATTGELIGRLPSMEMREKLWNAWFSDYGDDLLFDPPSFRDVKDIVERQFMRELKGAPFSQADRKLLPEAGSCKECPKRTGNNRGDYPDGRADICTDVACFKQKVEASNRRLLDSAADEGVRVLNEKEARQFFPYGGSLSWQKQEEFVDLDEECVSALEADGEDYDKPAPTYAGLLGDSIKPTVVGLDSLGNLHRLVPKSAAAEALREKGIEIESARRANGGSADFEYQKRRAEEEMRRKARGQAMEEIATAVAEWFDDHFARYRQDENVLMATLGKALLVCMGYPHVGAAMKRRFADLSSDANSSSGLGEIAEKLVKGADAADIIGTLAEVCARYELSQWSHGWQDKPTASICEFAGIDYKDFEKRALKALKEESNPKKKSKVKATAQA